MRTFLVFLLAAWGPAVAQAPAAPATAPATATAPAVATPATQSPAAAKPRPGPFRHAAIIPIRGEISDVTTESLERRIAEAQQAAADLIVLDMDTPGGMVSSTFDICDAIKALPEHTVAWVHSKAYSAGAIIAISCDEIVVSQRSRIGDAMPIAIGPEGPAAISKELAPKITSPLLEEIRDSALRNGYSVLMCEAMVVPDLVVYWVENSAAGERRFVQPGERNRLFGYAATQPADRESAPADQDPVASRTEWRYVESTPVIPDVKQPIVSSRELLTMSQNEALAYGFATEMISTTKELEAYYGLPGSPIVLDYTWSELLVAWLTSVSVRAILLVIVMVAGYVELNTPGVGLAGLAALIALALFLGAPYLTGLANVWDLLLFLTGAALVLLEILVIPGFGVAGITGIVLMLIGLVASFVPAEWPGQSPFHWPTMDYTWNALQQGLVATAAALVASLIGMILLSRYFQKLPYAAKLVPANPTPQQVSLEDWFADLPRPGEVGTTIGPLRPAGKARFGSKLADVVTEAEFIEAGQRVKVVERAGNRVVVRPADGQSGPAST